MTLYQIPVEVSIGFRNGESVDVEQTGFHLQERDGHGERDLTHAATLDGELERRLRVGKMVSWSVDGI